MGAPSLRTTINGVTYPVAADGGWRTVEQGRMLTERWTEGFAGGMGSYINEAPDRYYFGLHFDPTMRHKLRLRPRIVWTYNNVNIAAGSLKQYAFREKGSSNAFVYVLNDDQMWKLKLSDGTLAEERLLQTDLGRPVLFKGRWYFPRDSAAAQSIPTPVNNLGADTYTTHTWYARHLATGMKGATAQVLRAGDANVANSEHTVSLADDLTGAGNWGSKFDVGDNSSPINDVWWWRGQYVIVKSDGLYLFDPVGQAVSAVDYVKSVGSVDLLNGVNSYAQGDYFYWVNRSGLWRLTGNVARPIGFESELDWINQLMDGLQPTVPTDTWRSIAIYGNWAYVTRSNQLYCGAVRPDGSILWHGAIYQSAAGGLKCFVVESDTGNPCLILLEEDNILRIDLAQDGSLHTNFGSNRGAASLTASFFLPETDMGEPLRDKQLRTVALEVEGVDATSPVKVYVIRDNAVGPDAQVGSSITANGMTEVGWTPGTNDLARRFRLELVIATTGGYAPTTSDPRILKVEVRAATPSVIACRIPCTIEGLREVGISVSTAVNNLRDLIAGKRISITEPEWRDGVAGDAFNGYIISHDEVRSDNDSEEGAGYIFTLYIQRFDW